MTSGTEIPHWWIEHISSLEFVHILVGLLWLLLHWSCRPSWTLIYSEVGKTARLVYITFSCDFPYLFTTPHIYRNYPQPRSDKLTPQRISFYNEKLRRDTNKQQQYAVRWSFLFCCPRVWKLEDSTGDGDISYTE
ncbi:hypothetical protein QBC35DRAFT_104059 [Podospora australis]|uniref:Uncharacterized protein n=1 Tax=Podospora australis TaxID=1536484 RepID=A0AAN7AN96_9PEZI|nr:hypothetical protein QBC35DRAFT_104059 [Podospora australis]